MRVEECQGKSGLGQAWGDVPPQVLLLVSGRGTEEGSPVREAGLVRAAWTLMDPAGPLISGVTWESYRISLRLLPDLKWEQQGCLVGGRGLS